MSSSDLEPKMFESEMLISPSLATSIGAEPTNVVLAIWQTPTQLICAPEISEPAVQSIPSFTIVKDDSIHCWKAPELMVIS